MNIIHKQTFLLNLYFKTDNHKIGGEKMDKVQCPDCELFFDYLVDDGVCTNCLAKRLEQDED